MPTVTLDESYLPALKAAFVADLSTFPPFAAPPAIPAPTPTFHVGRYQQPDVETKVLLVTLHVGDPQEEAGSGDREWRHEVIANSDEFGVRGYAGAFWWYRYTIHIQYFFTRVRIPQEDALRNISRVLHWLRWRVQANPVQTLHGYGLVQRSDFGETMLLHRPFAEEVIEGGGPPRDYIMRAKLFVVAKVHVEPPT